MSNRNAHPKYVRALALLLGLGGLAGVLVCLWTFIALISQTRGLGWVPVAIMGLMVLVFCGCIWTSIDLWRRKPRAYMWATVLFLLQIPIISIPSFVYRFHTGLVLYLSLSRAPDTQFRAQFELGSLLSFQIPSGSDDWMLGVNLIALAAFIYLIKVSRSLKESSAASLSEDIMVRYRNALDTLAK